MSSADEKDSLTSSPPENEPETQPGSAQVVLEEGGAPRQASPNSKPPLKPNMVAQEVPLQAIGVRPGASLDERKLLSEETASVLVGSNGGVIRLAIGVSPGQLLLLTHLESKAEIVAQVKRRRMDKSTLCYVELEFAEPTNRFWGREFSAATALLPRDPREAEAAARILAAETIGEDQGEPPSAPAVEAVRAFRQEIDALLGRPSSIQTPDSSEEADDAESGFASPQANAGSFLPPQFKRKRPRARGSFTPGFRTGALRLAILSTLLVITMIGAAWYKHWIPWQSAQKKAPTSELLNVAGAAGAAPLATLPNPEPIKARPVPADVKAAANASADASSKEQHAAPQNEPSTQTKDVADSSSEGASDETTAQPAVERTTSRTKTAQQSPAAPATEKGVSEPVVASAANGSIVPPKLIKSVRATATMDAVRDFETGSVVISAVVGTNGQVESMNVISGPPSLRDEAMKALKQYRYEPATQNGQPVAARITVTIRFQFEP